MSAEVHLLHAGYVGPEDGDGLRVGSSVVLVRDRDGIVVVDPGLVPAPSAILDPLRALGVEPADVTDVVFSHLHIDHTLNAALFPAARFHDVMAVYRGDLWTDSDAEGRQVTDSVSLIRTPGHTAEDISTVIETGTGLVVCTHAWWTEDGPEEDPYAVDQGILDASRARILAMRPSLVIPGHGPGFRPS